MLFSSEHARSIPLQLLCDILAKGKPLENSREYTLKDFVQRLLPDETRITEKSRKFAQSAKRWAEQNPDEATRILIKRNPLAALRFVTLVGKRMEAETEQEFKKACYEDKGRKRFWVRYCARFAFVADNHNQILLDSFGDTDRNSRGATKEYISGIQRRKREALEKMSEFMTPGNLTDELHDYFFSTLISMIEEIERSGEKVTLKDLKKLATTSLRTPDRSISELLEMLQRPKWTKAAAP